MSFTAVAVDLGFCFGVSVAAFFFPGFVFCNFWVVVEVHTYLGHDALLAAVFSVSCHARLLQIILQSWRFGCVPLFSLSRGASDP